MGEHEEQHRRAEEEQELREVSNGASSPEDDADRIKNIVREVLSEQVKRDIVTETVKTAHAEEEKKVVAEAVGSASTLAARKTAVATAVETARDDQAEQEIIAAAVNNASNIEARKTAVAQAVNSARSENKKEIAGEAVEQLSSKQQREIAHRFLPSSEAADRIWVMIVKTFAIVLIVGMIALCGVVTLAVFREVDKDLVQIMLTVFSTVAGILAGFITGQAVGSSSNR